MQIMIFREHSASCLCDLCQKKCTNTLLNTEWQFMVKIEGNKWSNDGKRESNKFSKSNVWEGHVHICNVVIRLWESIPICKRDKITKEDPNNTKWVALFTARVFDHPSDRQSELLTKVEYHEDPFRDYLESSKQFYEREMAWKYMSTHY